MTAPPRSDLSIPRQELLWAANRDLCVAAKGQQIPVSRDDDVSPAFHRALEHAIVLGVRGDDRQPGLGLDDLGDLPELRVDLIGGGLGVAELRSGEDADAARGGWPGRGRGGARPSGQSRGRRAAGPRRRWQRRGRSCRGQAACPSGDQCGLRARRPAATAAATSPSFRPSRFAWRRPNLKIAFHRSLRSMYSRLASRTSSERVRDSLRAVRSILSRSGLGRAMFTVTVFTASSCRGRSVYTRFVYESTAALPAMLAALEQIRG